MSACCAESAYPGNPGMCVGAGSCSCHHTEDDPASDLVASMAARYDSGNGEAAALTAQALARLAYRRRHSGKTCQTCREDKPLAAFGPDAQRPDGLSHRCRACNSARMRAARARRV